MEIDVFVSVSFSSSRSRHPLHEPARGNPQAGGQPGHRQGGQVGGAEVPGAPPTGARHQVRPASVVLGHRLEPSDRLVLQEVRTYNT